MCKSYSAQVMVLRLLTAGSVEGQICKAAADKRALADRCITGGFFDGKTGAQERRLYLLSLIRPIGSAADRCCFCYLIMFRSSLHIGCSLKGVRSVGSADFDWKVQQGQPGMLHTRAIVLQ